MTQEEEIAQLKKQLSELAERFSEVVEHLSKAQARESHLLAQVSAMQAENQALQEQLAVAQKRIEELEKQKTPPAAFVKASAGQADRRGEEAAQEARCPVQSRPASRSADPSGRASHQAVSGVCECVRRVKSGPSPTSDRIATATASRGEGACGVPRLV